MPNRAFLEKVVVHLADRKLLKGYMDMADSMAGIGIVSNGHSAPEQIELELVSGERARIDLRSAKALFFVKEFDGQPQYSDLRFFRRTPEFAGLWVRLRFHDDELAEGLVQNSLEFLLSRGFLMKPSDPRSNNRFIYALKSALTGFEVLGLRNEY
jgi:hypothetical protein